MRCGRGGVSLPEGHAPTRPPCEPVATLLGALHLLTLHGRHLGRVGGTPRGWGLQHKHRLLLLLFLFSIVTIHTRLTLSGDICLLWPKIKIGMNIYARHVS